MGLSLKRWNMYTGKAKSLYMPSYYYCLGVKMMDHKEAYRYTNYIQNLQGSKIKTLPPTICPIEEPCIADNHHAAASTFMEYANNPGDAGGFDDFFKQKVELSEDKVNLILSDIYRRESLRKSNLLMLYEDLHKINNWRLERPFPDYYSKDRIWSDLNRSELQIREQIRREMKDAVRDMAFPQKDLRESLLEFKLQTHKNQLLEGDLEMELDGSYFTPTGDTNSKGTY
jgi:hypothetical protein